MTPNILTPKVLKQSDIHLSDIYDSFLICDELDQRLSEIMYI